MEHVGQAIGGRHSRRSICSMFLLRQPSVHSWLMLCKSGKNFFFAGIQFSKRTGYVFRLLSEVKLIG